MPRKPFPHNLAIVGLCAFLLLLYGSVWFRLLSDPSLRSLDFLSFYAAGRIAADGNSQNLYDVQTQAQAQARVTSQPDGEPLLFIHPPYLLPLLSLIAIDDYETAYVLWTLILLGTLSVGGFLLHRHLREAGWDVQSATLGVVGLASFFPVFTSILGGQDTLFTLLGLWIWAFYFVKRRDAASGLGLALASLSPITAGLLFLPSSAARPRIGIWFLTGSLFLALLSLALIGFDGLQAFARILLLTSQGEFYGFNWAGMYNLIGLLTRGFPALPPGLLKGISWTVVFLCVVFLSAFWRKKGSGIRMSDIGFAVALSTFISPHLYLHSLAFLTLAFLAPMQACYAGGKRFIALLLAPLTSFTMLFLSLFSPALLFACGYGLMACLLFANLRSD